LAARPPQGGVHPEISLSHTQDRERLRARPSERSKILDHRCPMTHDGIADLKAANTTAPRRRDAREAAE